MGLRIRKTLTLLPGVKINLSKGGASVSLGKKGMSYNIGKNGSRTTVGIPGSGISYSSYKRRKPENDNAPGAGLPRWLWPVLVVGLIAATSYYNIK